jgi:hypothetical protein
MEGFHFSRDRHSCAIGDQSSTGEIGPPHSLPVKPVPYRTYDMHRLISSLAHFAIVSFHMLPCYYDCISSNFLV